MSMSYSIFLSHSSAHVVPFCGAMTITTSSSSAKTPGPTVPKRIKASFLALPPIASLGWAFSSELRRCPQSMRSITGRMDAKARGMPAKTPRKVEYTKFKRRRRICSYRYPSSRCPDSKRRQEIGKLKMEFQIVFEMSAMQIGNSRQNTGAPRTLAQRLLNTDSYSLPLIACQHQSSLSDDFQNCSDAVSVEGGIHW